MEPPSARLVAAGSTSLSTVLAQVITKDKRQHQKTKNKKIRQTKDNKRQQQRQKQQKTTTKDNNDDDDDDDAPVLLTAPRPFPGLLQRIMHRTVIVMLLK
jgi:hypothetical protein